MTPEQTDLARSFVALPGWRWMPGMLVLSATNIHHPARIESIDGDTYGLTVVPGPDGAVFVGHHEYGVVGAFPRESSVPDLNDPATLGCILTLIREASGDPCAHLAWECGVAFGTQAVFDGWRVRYGSGVPMGPMSSDEALALYEALKAAGGGSDED